MLFHCYQLLFYRLYIYIMKLSDLFYVECRYNILKRQSHKIFFSLDSDNIYFNFYVVFILCNNNFLNKKIMTAGGHR